MSQLPLPREGTGVPRIPLNTLAISFGLAGLAGVWTAACVALSLPRAIAEVLWVVAAAAWVWLIVAHTVRGARSRETLLSQLTHPAQGPIASLVPAVGMLLGANLHAAWPVGGTVLVAASITAAAIFAGWIVSLWISHPLEPGALHGAYLLPTAGSSLIAATTSYKVGLGAISMAAFAVGIVFSVIIITILLARFAFLPPLPQPLTPTIAILLAPPAVGGTAWFTMNGMRIDPISASLLGLLVVMVIVQLFLIGFYRKLPFSLGFWSFTFPVAATAIYGIQWFAIVQFAGWQAATVVVLVGCTALIGAIAVRSIMLVTTGRNATRRAESALLIADRSAEQPASNGTVR